MSIEHTIAKYLSKEEAEKFLEELRRLEEEHSKEIDKEFVKYLMGVAVAQKLLSPVITTLAVLSNIRQPIVVYGRKGDIIVASILTKCGEPVYQIIYNLALKQLDIQPRWKI